MIEKASAKRGELILKSSLRKWRPGFFYVEGRGMGGQEVTDACRLVGAGRGPGDALSLVT